MPDKPAPRARNVGASVGQRLLNLAHARGQPLELLLTRYALERLLRSALAPAAREGVGQCPGGPGATEPELAGSPKCYTRSAETFTRKTFNHLRYSA